MGFLKVWFQGVINNDIDVLMKKFKKQQLFKKSSEMCQLHLCNLSRYFLGSELVSPLV